MGTKTTSTFGGAASGAAAGAPLGPYGVAGGAVIGGGLGFLAGSEAEEIGRAQQEAYARAMAGQRQAGERAYDMYSNLNTSSQSFYGPARSAYEELYGGGTGTSYGAPQGPGGYAPLPRRPLSNTGAGGWHAPLDADGTYHAQPVSGGGSSSIVSPNGMIVSPTAPTGYPAVSPGSGYSGPTAPTAPVSYSMRSGSGGGDFSNNYGARISDLTTGGGSIGGAPSQAPSSNPYDRLMGGSSGGGSLPGQGYSQTGGQYKPLANGGVSPQMTVPGGYQQQSPQRNDTNGMPTQARDQYYATQARNAGPTNSQSYFDAYKPTTYMQDYTSGRQTQGINGGQLDRDYNALSGWATSGQSQATDRMGELRNLGSTSTSGMLGELSGYNASQRTDDIRNSFATKDIGVSAQEAQGRISSGQSAAGQLSSNISSGNTDSGRLLGQMGAGTSATGALQSDLAAGRSPTGTLQSSIASDRGDTGAFLKGFDTTKTAGLGDTYAKLAGEKNGYMEDFYTSQVAGTNPAYEQLKADFARDTRNSAAARGGFVSGKAIDIENRGLSRLAADEFANRGNLANMAEQARRVRLGQELSGAQSMDAAYLGRQQLQAQTGLGRENILAGLASSREGNMTGLATAREGNMTGLSLGRDNTLAGLATGQDAGYNQLAQSRDQSELARMGLVAGLATSGDELGMNLQGLRLQGSGQEDNIQLARQNQINGLATSADATDLSRRGLMVNAAGQIDSNAISRQAQLDSLAGLSGQEAFSGQQLGGQLADNADSANLGRDSMLNSAAGQASNEQRAVAKDKFDSAMRMGDAGAALNQANGAAAIGALTQSDIAALDSMLAASGVDAASRMASIQALTNTVSSLGAAGITAYGNQQDPRK